MDESDIERFIEEELEKLNVNLSETDSDSDTDIKVDCTESVEMVCVQYISQSFMLCSVCEYCVSSQYTNTL